MTRDLRSAVAWRWLLRSAKRSWAALTTGRWGFPLCHDDVPDPVSISHFIAR